MSTEKQLFELSDDEYAEILAASQPVPYLIIGGVAPISPQERANHAWQRLGKARGFDWRSVSAGPDEQHILAEPVGPVGVSE